MTKAESNLPEDDNQRLRAVQGFTTTLDSSLELDVLLPKLASQLHQTLSCQHVLLFVADADGYSLEYGHMRPPLADKAHQTALEQSSLNTYSLHQAQRLQPLSRGDIVTCTHAEASETPLHPLHVLANIAYGTYVPLYLDEQMVGLLGLISDAPLSAWDRALLPDLQPHLARALGNARQHTRMMHSMANSMKEMNMLAQIDAELNDRIDINHILHMILDWALRYTLSHAAGMVRYHAETDTLSMMAHYGYTLLADDSPILTSDFSGGIAHRAARSGEVEVVPDVSQDDDYIPTANGIRSQLSAPILREGQVIAVLSLESRRLNAFTEEHIAFTRKLNSRAGVAVDNARLFAESQRERSRLDYILRNIADAVMVVTLDDRILLINQSVLSALNLPTERVYVGQSFNNAMPYQPLRDLFARATESGDGLLEEIELPNERIYSIRITQLDAIGWIIVMQDITSFKEMDELKSDLLATVSHDLKQPLSVMRGYLDLLKMSYEFDDRAQYFLQNLERSFLAMRNLIDDLLDIARIEAGLELEIEAVDLRSVLTEALSNVRPSAVEKEQQIEIDLPEQVPPISGDPRRLSQIFTNLIGNAIKYTNRGGSIRVGLEIRSMVVRVSVEDNGMGISPENQAHIFERFYRVRRPETEDIEGTGLGLAIVKSLVEAHRGQIDLVSELGVGTTFRVTLPVD